MYSWPHPPPPPAAQTAPPSDSDRAPGPHLLGARPVGCGRTIRTASLIPSHLPLGLLPLWNTGAPVVAFSTVGGCGHMTCRNCLAPLPLLFCNFLRHLFPFYLASRIFEVPWVQLTTSVRLAHRSSMILMAWR